ncbi:MAG: ABC transporter ATP-binding protein [Deltaproteobacteria bacterium]|nr:ABC transporter ATP-binding protein [Deltaproteobacteria bacterium]
MTSNNIAIKVEKISKCYRIGLKEKKHETFGGALIHFIKSPLNNYRKHRSLYKFDDPNPGHDKNVTDNAFDIIWALRDISFEVKQGEVVGVIGKNGAGKSTFLKILSRITNPTSGRAEIRGRISSLLEVGTGFHQELTGKENVYLNGTILGMKKKEVDRKFDEIVEFSGVEKFIDTPVKRYSSGMKVRLAFAVAAYLEPEILLVDEVLAVGDAEFQKKCLNKMEDVGQQGRTVLFVSHNMPAVTRLCNRTILLDEGRVLEDGPSDRVVRAYLNSDSGTIAERRWRDPAKAPCGDVARLHCVRVRTKNGRVSEAVDIRQPVGLEMEYEVLKSGWTLMPHYHIFNEEGVQLFSAHDTDPGWRDRPRPAGRYKSTAWIPGNLLSEGTIFVSSGLITLDPNTPQFYERAAVAFQVIEGDSVNSARGGWAGPMKGIVRPLLEWQTELSKG